MISDMEAMSEMMQQRRHLMLKARAVHSAPWPLERHGYTPRLMETIHAYLQA